MKRWVIKWYDWQGRMRITTAINAADKSHAVAVFRQMTSAEIDLVAEVTE